MIGLKRISAAMTEIQRYHLSLLRYPTRSRTGTRQLAARPRQRSEIVWTGVFDSQLQVFEMPGDGGLRLTAVGRSAACCQTL